MQVLFLVFVVFLCFSVGNFGFLYICIKLLKFIYINVILFLTIVKGGIVMGNIPVKLIGYAAIGIFALCCIIFLWSLVLCILKIKNTKCQDKKAVIIMSLCSVGIVAASWLLNIGWLRFIMTLFLVPFIHAAVFFTVNIVAAHFWENSFKLKVCNLLFVATYVLTYVLYPDSGNADSVYFFFGLVHNPVAVSVVQKIANCMMMLHLVLFVVQLVFVATAKKPATEVIEEIAEEKIKEESEEVEAEEETTNAETNE